MMVPIPGSGLVPMQDVPIERLVESHEAWVALARRVVEDLADPQDVVQDAYAAVLERPPTRAIDIPKYFAGVVRNTALRHRRTNLRRRRRESVAAHRDPPRGPIAELACKDAVEAVREAVDALDEQDRVMVILRYMEGLEPKEIAARLGMRDATVRSRLHRAREAMRGVLEPRTDWPLVQSLLLGTPRRRRGVSKRLSGRRLLLRGGLLLGSLMGSVALVMVVFWLVDDRGGGQQSSDSSTVVRETREDADVWPGLPVLGTAPEQLRFEQVRSEASGAFVTTMGSMSGAVIDRITASPISGKNIVATRRSGIRVRPGETIQVHQEFETSTDAYGQFTFGCIPIGAYRLAVDGTPLPDLFVAMQDGWKCLAMVDVGGNGPFRVQVVDSLGLPLRGVPVEMWALHGKREGLELVVGETNAGGVAVFDVLTPLEAYFISRPMPGVAAIRMWSPRPSSFSPRDICLVVRKTGRVEGRLDVPIDEREEFCGTKVELAWGPVSVTCELDSDGRFFSPELPAGRYMLKFDAARGRRIDYAYDGALKRDDGLDLAPERGVVYVEPGRVSVARGSVASGATLRGIVMSARGEDFVGTVRLWKPRFWNGVLPSLHTISRETMTQDLTVADAGAFEFMGMPSGRWVVDVWGAGSSSERRIVELVDGRVSNVELDLHSMAGELQVIGAFRYVSTPGLVLRRLGGVDPVVCRIPGKGAPFAYSIVGLSPGLYEICTMSRTGELDPVSEPIEVVEGRVSVAECYMSKGSADSRLRTRGGSELNGYLRFDCGEVVVLGPGGWFSHSVPTRNWVCRHVDYFPLSKLDTRVPVRIVPRDAHADYEISLPEGRIDVRCRYLGLGVNAVKIALEHASSRGDPFQVLSVQRAVGEMNTFSGLPAGSYTVRLAGDGVVLDEEVVVLDADETRRLQLSMPEVGGLHVRVTNAYGRPIAHSKVSIHLSRSAGTLGLQHGWRLTDEKGVVEIRDVPEGRVDVNVSAPESLEYKRVVKSVSVQRAMIGRVEVVLQ